jgi:hypothetical protein
MIVIEPATEHEMVLAFVKAEIDSPRYRQHYQQLITALGFSRTQLIESADLHNDRQNMERSKLLQGIRGYGANGYLFRGFPNDVAWQRVRIDRSELERMKYANHETWMKLSAGTRLVRDGARNIDHIQVSENATVTINDNIKDVAEALRNGQSYPELIAVSGPSDVLILVEGHTRATAYVISGYSQPITCLVGTSARMSQWAFYQRMRERVSKTVVLESPKRETEPYEISLTN